MRRLASALFVFVLLAGCSGGRPEGSNSLAPVTPYGAVPLYNEAGLTSQTVSLDPRTIDESEGRLAGKLAGGLALPRR